jgi:hypothetical protein
MKCLLFIAQRFAPDFWGVAWIATGLVNTLTQLDIKVDVVTTRNCPNKIGRN